MSSPKWSAGDVPAGCFGMWSDDGDGFTVIRFGDVMAADWSATGEGLKVFLPNMVHTFPRCRRETAVAFFRGWCDFRAVAP